MYAPIALDIDATYEILALELVQHRSNARAGHDQAFSQFRLSRFAAAEFQREQHIELRFRQVVPAEKLRCFRRQQGRRPHDIEYGFVPNVLERRLKPKFGVKFTNKCPRLEFKLKHKKLFIFKHPQL